MPDIAQLTAVSYPAVLNESGKAANQFAESALLNLMKKKGAIKTEPFGTVIEHTLDYQRNPGAEFIATDITGTSLAKTESITAAQYAEGQIVVPVTWTFADEAKNPSLNQKINFVTQLLESALTSHDDLLEEALFASSTNGFLGLPGLFPSGGQGSPGGIDAATEAWWRHYSSTFASNGSDIVAKLTAAMKAAAKGSGGAMPDIIVSGDAPHTLYEGTQQAYIRYENVDSANAGFKTLMFGPATYIFSQYGSDTIIHGFNSKHVKLRMAKGASRRMGDKMELQNQPGYTRKLYTMCQLTTNNKSRGFYLSQA